MNRTHATTDDCTLHYRPQSGLSSVLVRLACEGAVRFSGGKSASEGCDRPALSTVSAFTGWLNPDQLIGRGRCRFTLTPT